MLNWMPPSYTRRILDEAGKGKYIDISVDIDSLTKKGYNNNKVIQALSMIIAIQLKTIGIRTRLCNK